MYESGWALDTLDTSPLFFTANTDNYRAQVCRRRTEEDSSSQRRRPLLIATMYDLSTIWTCSDMSFKFYRGGGGGVRGLEVGDNVINFITYLDTLRDMRNSLWRQHLITEMMTRIWDRLSIIRLQTLDMNWKDHRPLLSCYAPANESHLRTAPKLRWKTAIWGASLFLRRKAK